MYFDLEYCRKRFPILEFYLTKWANKLQNLKNREICLTLLKFRKDFESNVFIEEEAKEQMIVYLENCIRRYYLENKYLTLWNLKHLHRRKPINLYDLQFDPIDVNDSTLIHYIHYKNRNKYIFTQKDFKQIITNSLFHSYLYDCLPDPIPIKNPYDNTLLTRNELLFIDKQLIDPPLVWVLYKESGFHIETFKVQFQYYLQKNCISSFLSTLENEDFEFYLDDIMEYFKVDRSEYCIKCLSTPSLYRKHSVLDGLYLWFCHLRFGKKFTSKDLERLLKLFKKPCSLHKKKEKKREIAVNKINFTSTSTCEFTKDKEDIFVFQSTSVAFSKKSFTRRQKKTEIKTTRVLPFSIPSSSIEVELVEDLGGIKMVLTEKLFNHNSFIKNIL